jgi:2,3-bisphosphoglycerate-dependent phosphoglycerate mutase
MIKIVFLRHGESTWNLENRFTGWTDVDLSAHGINEARAAGQLLKSTGYTFDYAYTSLLKRAIRTTWLVQDTMDLMWVQTEKDWRLNERHYGALQGLNKEEVAAHYGPAQVHEWRRGFAVRPPALGITDPRLPYHDRRYADVPAMQLPWTESLQDTMKRSIACWEERILPGLWKGQRILVVAHGNTLRALMKHLEQMSDQEVMELNIPTGAPLVYEFDDTLRVQARYYLDESLNPDSYTPHHHAA